MRKYFVFAALGLASCITDINPADYRPASLSEAQVRVVQESVKNALRDPESARFSNIGAVSGKGGITVCGLVNSKNGFGGYAGFSAFRGTLTGASFTVAGIDETSQIFNATACKRYGITL